MSTKPFLRHDKSKINLHLTFPAQAPSHLQTAIGPFKTYLKNKTLSLQAEDDCALCRQKIRRRMMPALVNRALAVKYSNSVNYYYTKDINDALAGVRCKACLDVLECRFESGERDCVVSYVDRAGFRDKFNNLWKYHQFNIDQPKQDYRGILEIVEGYFHGKRRIQEKAIKKMLDVMTDSELEGCEIHLSRFAAQPLEIVENPYDDSERIIPKAISGERKASSISLSIIEAIGKSLKTGKTIKSQPSSARPYSKYMFTQYGDSHQMSGFSQFFDSDIKQEQRNIESIEWPSFIDNEERKQLDKMSNSKSTAQKPQSTVLKLDRYFSKKAYQEKVSLLMDTRKSKNLTGRKDGSFSGSASGKHGGIISKSRNKKELNKIESISNEKRLRNKTIEKGKSPDDQDKLKKIQASVSKLKIKDKKLPVTSSTKKLMSQVASKLANKLTSTNQECKIQLPITKLAKSIKAEIAEKNISNLIGLTYKPKVPTQRAVSRSKSSKKSQPTTGVSNCDAIVSASSCFKSKSFEKRLTSIPNKKSKAIKTILSTANRLDQCMRKTRCKGQLDSTFAKSIGIRQRGYDKDIKRLKSRPMFVQQASNAKTLPDVAGYDPFMHSSYQAASSPRDLMMSATKKPKLDSSQVNVYSAGFMHKIILSKRNQMSETKLGQVSLTSGLANDDRGNQFSSRTKFRQGGSSSLHQMYTGPSFETKIKSRSPPNYSPKNSSRPRIN